MAVFGRNNWGSENYKEDNKPQSTQSFTEGARGKCGMRSEERGIGKNVFAVS
jgi:hypothetical protein